MSTSLTGPSLIGIGILHLAFTPVFQPGFADLLRARLTGGDRGTLADRALQEAGFWYVVTGIGVLLLGGLAWWAERRLTRLPTAFGVTLLLLAGCGLLLGPLTGFWLFLLPGALVLLRRRSAPQEPKREPTSRR